MLEQEFIPDKWKEAAKLTLAGADITHLSLAAPQSTSSPAIASNSTSVTLRLKDKKTIAAEFGYNPALAARFKFEVDGRKWNSDDRCWEFPLAQLPRAVRVFGESNIRFEDSVREQYESLVERREDLDSIRAQEDTEFKIPGMKLNLYPYQAVGVQFIDRAGGRCLIADAPGLGKTVQAIAYGHLHNYKTLIVCPLSVVLNWKKEIKKFLGKEATIWDSKKHYGKLSNQFHIIHYDAVSKAIGSLRKQEFDLLVCDEATFLKNRQTIRAKTILGIYKERRKYPGIKTKKCIFLTGTPVMSRPIEAYSLLNFLDKERFKDFYHFVQKYGGWRGEASRNLEDLHDRTKDLVIRRKKNQVMKELPEKQRNDLYVELTASEQKEYHKLLMDVVGRWKVERPSIAHMPKLQGFLIKKKMPRLVEIIDEYLDNDQSILIFSCYIEPLKALEKHYGQEKVALLHGSMNKAERQESVDRLASKQARIGAFSIRAGGMGIDGLQHVMDTVIFLDMDWVPANHEQAEDRTHRIGQTNQVQAYYMMCADTIDEYMREILREKQQIADIIVDGEALELNRQKSFFKVFVAKLGEELQQSISTKNIDE